MRKGGPLKFWRFEKRGPEKKHANFTPKNWVYLISVGLTPIFHGKRGGGLKKMRSKGGGLKSCRADFFFLFHQVPLQVFVNGPLVDLLFSLYYFNLVGVTSHTCVPHFLYLFFSYIIIVFFFLLTKLCEM